MNNFKDGNGYLTLDELKQVFNANNDKNVDEKVWNELIQGADQDGDGQVKNIYFFKY